MVHMGRKRGTAHREIKTPGAYEESEEDPARGKEALPPAGGRGLSATMKWYNQLKEVPHESG